MIKKILNRNISEEESFKLLKNTKKIKYKEKIYSVNELHSIYLLKVNQNYLLNFFKNEINIMNTSDNEFKRLFSDNLLKRILMEGSNELKSLIKIKLRLFLREII